MAELEAGETGEIKGFGKIKTLEKVSKSKAELFGILASVSTKLEELNEGDLHFVTRNIKQTFNPDPNFAKTSLLEEGMFTKAYNESKDE